MTGLRANPRVRCIALGLLLGGFLLLSLGACGDNDAPSADTDSPNSPEAGWSDHAGGGAGPVGTGSPERVRAPGAVTPVGLVATLRARVATGRGMADAGYDAEVRDVAEVLWPADGTVEERSGAQVHVQVSAIAVQVGGWFKASGEARAEREKSDPIDVKIYTAFLRATEAGPDAYRTWCEADGAALLKALAAARRERFFPKR